MSDPAHGLAQAATAEGVMPTRSRSRAKPATTSRDSGSMGGADDRRRDAAEQIHGRLHALMRVGGRFPHPVNRLLEHVDPIRYRAGLRQTIGQRGG